MMLFGDSPVYMVRKNLILPMILVALFLLPMLTIGVSGATKTANDKTLVNSAEIYIRFRYNATAADGSPPSRSPYGNGMVERLGVWKDANQSAILIDFKFNQTAKGLIVEVQRSIVRSKISTPKSGKSRRVDMTPYLTETFKKHRLDNKKKGLKLGLGDLPEYVFINTKGGFIDKDNWRRRIFNKALQKAEMRRIRIHDLRHTYATLRISKGDNIADVSNQLGHHSIKLTMDVYYHFCFL